MEPLLLSVGPWSRAASSARDLPALLSGLARLGYAPDERTLEAAVAQMQVRGCRGGGGRRGGVPGHTCPALLSGLARLGCALNEYIRWRRRWRRCRCKIVVCARLGLPALVQLIDAPSERALEYYAPGPGK